MFLLAYTVRLLVVCIPTVSLMMACMSILIVYVIPYTNQLINKNIIV